MTYFGACDVAKTAVQNAMFSVRICSGLTRNEVVNWVFLPLAWEEALLLAPPSPAAE